MIRPFKSKKDLARELEIHPKTLNRYMRNLGIEWGKKPMPAAVWEKVVQELQCDTLSLKQSYPKKNQSLD